jgi:hypothetical protein
VKLKKGYSAVVMNTVQRSAVKKRMASIDDSFIRVIVKRLKEAVLRGFPLLGQRNKPRVYNQVYMRRRIVLEQWFLICGSRNGGTERVCVFSVLSDALIC